jgi:blocked-early-in-transport protein 1
MFYSFSRSDRDDLFSTYNRSASPSKSKPSKPRSPYGAGGYGYTSPASDTSFSAYPGASTNGSLYPGTSAGGGGNEPFRAATPNSRGQYSAAVLDELESQNDNEHVGILTSKVKQLKDVRIFFPSLFSFVSSHTFLVFVLDWG